MSPTAPRRSPEPGAPAPAERERQLAVTPPAWAEDLRAGIRRAADLRRLPVAPAQLERDRAAAEAFKVRVPASYLGLIDWSDPDDPIRRQAIPSAAELQPLPGERPDPIGDAAHSPVPHLTHRYPDRVLLYPTYVCSMYCRHCFRKESLNEGEHGVALAHLGPALAYIAEHSELREVILTGGDPLTLSDAQLAQLRARIEAIPHIRLLRVHTRVPVTLPTRVTPGLVDALRGRLITAVVTHFNHPREITEDAAVACRRLREAGLMLLNQSVLLRGVNDDPKTLETLVRELVYTLGAKPYYLHHCDLTRGVSHFRTGLDEGLALVKGLRGRVSGLCVPHYVLDLPGGHGKVPLAAPVVHRREGSRWELEAWDGRIHAYEEQLRPSLDVVREPEAAPSIEAVAAPTIGVQTATGSGAAVASRSGAAAVPRSGAEAAKGSGTAAAPRIGAAAATVSSVKIVSGRPPRAPAAEAPHELDARARVIAAAQTLLREGPRVVWDEASRRVGTALRSVGRALARPIP